MNLTPQYKFIAIVLGGILFHAALAGLVWFFLFMPIQQSHATLLQAKNELAVLGKRTRLLKDLEEVIQTEQEHFTLIDNAFLKPDKVVDFIEAVEHIAESAGVDIVFSSANIPGSAGGASSEVSFALEGSYSQVMRAVALLEHMSYHTEITAITVSGPDISHAHAQISMDVFTTTL